MKTLKIVAMVAGVLLLAGCGNKAVQNTNDTGTNDSGMNEAPQAENQGAMGGVISSIKDAMASGKTMKCTYTIKGADGGDMTATSYVDGGKYKTEMTVAGNTQNMIFDSEAMYSWADGQKQGMKMTTACSKELAANAPKDQTNAVNEPDPTGEKTFDNATDVSCEPASDVDFSLPTDVTFIDQCEMMKNVMKNVPSRVKVPTNIPNMPSGVPRAVPPAMPNGE